MTLYCVILCLHCVEWMYCITRLTPELIKGVWLCFVSPNSYAARRVTCSRLALWRMRSSRGNIRSRNSTTSTCICWRKRCRRASGRRFRPRSRPSLCSWWPTAGTLIPRRGMQMFECEWARRCVHMLCVSCAEEAGISPSIISPAHALLHLLYVLCFMRVNTATNNFLFSFFYFFLILLSFFANRPTYEEITVRVVNMLPSLAPTLAASAQHLLIEPAKQAGRGKV